MKAYEAASEIEGTPDAVWAVLVDVAAYPQWDSGVRSVKGEVKRGAQLTVVSEANPKRPIPVRVVELAPPSRMVWAGGMPLGLFRGVRTFTLTPRAGGGTAFVMREEYGGPLLRLIWRSMPDLAPSFAQFAAGLKQRVEGRT